MQAQTYLQPAPAHASMATIRTSNALADRRRSTPARTTPGSRGLRRHLRARRIPDQSARLVRAFARAATNLGATLHRQTEITGIQRHNTNVTGVTTSAGETIACDHLIVASGAWTARCSDWLDFPLPVSPQRGQILSLGQPSPPSLPLRHIIFGEAAY